MLTCTLSCKQEIYNADTPVWDRLRDGASCEAAGGMGRIAPQSYTFPHYRAILICNYSKYDKKTGRGCNK